jgi:hypothetical protein
LSSTFILTRFPDGEGGSVVVAEGALVVKEASGPSTVVLALWTSSRTWYVVSGSRPLKEAEIATEAVPLPRS